MYKRQGEDRASDVEPAEDPVGARDDLADVGRVLGDGGDGRDTVSYTHLDVYKRQVKHIAVLLGIIVGCVVAAGLGKMSFDKVGKASWFGVVKPFAFGVPTFDICLLYTSRCV